jgi:hypothetical protein
MSILIEPGRDVEEWLREQAAAQGMAVEQYAAGILREAVSRPGGAIANGQERPTLAEFEADLAALAEGLDHIPPLPPEAFSREAMYGERD